MTCYSLCISETVINKTIINDTVDNSLGNVYDQSAHIFQNNPYLFVSKIRGLTENSSLVIGSEHSAKVQDEFPVLAEMNENDVITMKPEKTSNHSSAEAVGCPYYYDWCMSTPVVFLWQFLLGTFFVAVGYPTCNVMSYSIFSKILGPKPQVRFFYDIKMIFLQ